MPGTPSWAGLDDAHIYLVSQMWESSAGGLTDGGCLPSSWDTRRKMNPSTWQPQASSILQQLLMAQPRLPAGAHPLLKPLPGCKEPRRLCHLVFPEPAQMRWLSPSSFRGCTRMQMLKQHQQHRPQELPLRAPSQRTSICGTHQHGHKGRGASPNSIRHVLGDATRLFGKGCLSQPPCSTERGVCLPPVPQGSPVPGGFPPCPRARVGLTS